MTNKNNISSDSEKGVRTQPVAVEMLAERDQIVWPGGDVATVETVLLYSPRKSARARKRPHCRIRVTIHGQSGNTRGSVTAEPGDCFDKLVGVEQS